MSALSVEELHRIAVAYEELLVPAFLKEFAGQLTEAARIGPGDHVLDVACGTGILARTAAARVGLHGAVTGVDVNPGMLRVAARVAPGVSWREGSAEALPFDNQSFGAVVSQFGLMFFADRRAALQQMNRVLRSGGRLAVAVFDALDRGAPYAAMATLVERVVGPSAAEALRAPFALGDRRMLQALFTDAGVVAAIVTTQRATARFPSVRAMVMADAKGWFPLAGIRLSDRQLETLVGEAARALGSCVLSDGRVEFPIAAHVVTALKP